MEQTGQQRQGLDLQQHRPRRSDAPAAPPRHAASQRATPPGGGRPSRDGSARGGGHGGTDTRGRRRPKGRALPVAVPPQIVALGLNNSRRIFQNTKCIFKGSFFCAYLFPYVSLESWIVGVRLFVSARTRFTRTVTKALTLALALMRR